MGTQRIPLCWCSFHDGPCPVHPRPIERVEDVAASPMSDERLAEIKAKYEEEYSFIDLLAEIHRLRRENQLLKLSQGDLGAVGQD